MIKSKKSFLGTVLGLGLGTALAIGIVTGSPTGSMPEAEAWGIYIPPGGGNTEACETCFGLYVCTVAYGTGGVCGITLGRCHTVGSCSPGGGGVWNP